MRGCGGFARIALAIAIVTGSSGAGRAEIARAPDSFAIPIASGKPALGAGWDSAASASRGEPGACVEDLGTERSEEASARYSLVTLSRVGGRLVVGAHVAVVTAVETLASPRLTDASRRLGGTDGGAFRELCGDGFVAKTELGGQWMGEIEVDPADAARAGARLTTGSWSDPEPFRAALEALVKVRVTTRELPGGKRAATIDLAPAAFIERAVSFPERVTAATEQPFVAVFAGYTRESLSGVVLSGADELDGREVAERVFRAGQPSPTSTAASRAAEMRLAQVKRYEPDEQASAQDAEPIVISNESLERLNAAPPAAQAPNSSPLRTRSAPAAASPAGDVRRQAAFVFEKAGGPVVYATTVAPGGVHAERQRQRYYWVPGAATATPSVEQAIEAAKHGAPVRGVTVAIVEVGANVVVMTDAPPLAGVHSVAAGERRAWIAGVSQPDATQQAALAEAVRAERAAQ